MNSNTRDYPFLSPSGWFIWPRSTNNEPEPGKQAAKDDGEAAKAGEAE